MSQSTFRMGVVISGAFKTVFARPVWFIGVPFALMALVALATYLYGIAIGYVGTMLVSPLITAVMTGAALGQIRGEGNLVASATDNLGRSVFTFIGYFIVIYAAMAGIGYLLYLIFVPSGDPLVQAVISGYGDLLFSGDIQAFMDAMERIENSDPSGLLGLFGAIFLFGLISLALSLLLMAYLAPFNGVVVDERLGIGAVGRSMRLTKGMRGQMLGVSLLLVIISIGLGFGASMVSSIFTMPMMMRLSPEDLLGGQMAEFQSTVQAIGTLTSGLVVGWMPVAFAHLYVELRRAQDGDQELYEQTFA